MVRTPLMIPQALADDRVSVATAGELHEAVEALRDQLDTLLEELDTYIDAEERAERVEAREVLTDTAGDALAELTTFGMVKKEPTFEPDLS
jgi:septation ring formation regulator EzrA